MMEWRIEYGHFVWLPGRGVALNMEQVIAVEFARDGSATVVTSRAAGQWGSLHFSGAEDIAALHGALGLVVKK